LAASTPDDWHFKESITLLAPKGNANVIFSSEPLDGKYDTEAYANIQGDLLYREFPGFRQFSLEEFVLVSGQQGLLRRFEWTPPDGAPVTQMQFYYASNGRGYTATATATSKDISEVELQLSEILDGLAIEPLAIEPQ